jgi:hypothetical protein
MELAAKLDDYGKPAWITLMVVSFIVFWPVGLAVLAYLIWSGRMGCSKRNFGRWYNQDGSSRRRHGSRRGKQQSSGNTAFDEYREDMLKRLEEEQEEFHAYLDQLRMAKDKAEFDQFMSDRSRRRDAPDGTAEASPAG